MSDVGVILPGALATASGWTLTDYVNRQLRSEPAAGGVCQVEFAQLDGNELWLVDHAVVACDSTSATSVRWYAGAVSDLALLDGSDSGNFDVADWPNGLQVQPTTALVVRWTGVSDGARGVVSVQARSMRR